MGCGASVDGYDEEEPEPEEITEANAPIARPRGGGKPPALPEGKAYEFFTVVTPAGKSEDFGNIPTGEPIAVYSPDGQELEVPCPAGYNCERSEFLCKYVPDPDPSRPAPPFVGSGAGENWVPASSGSSGGTAKNPSGRVALRLCNECSHGHAGQACFKCGAHIPPHQRAIAPSCRSCSLGRKGEECAKCGKCERRESNPPDSSRPCSRRARSLRPGFDSRPIRPRQGGSPPLPLMRLWPRLRALRQVRQLLRRIPRMTGADTHTRRPGRSSHARTAAGIRTGAPASWRPDRRRARRYVDQVCGVRARRDAVRNTKVTLREMHG